MYATGTIDHRGLVAAHAAAATRVVGGLGVVAHVLVELGVGLRLGARCQLAAAIGVQRGLGDDLAGQADGGAELFPVTLLGHVVEED